MEKLVKIKHRSKKRVGRGYSSGKGGHTTGRGAKGQKARSKVGLLFQGMKTKKSLVKKLPLQRGKGRFKPLNQKPLPVDVSLLNFFKEGDKVEVASLVKKGIIKSKDALDGVKILGKSEVKVAVSVLVACSRQAKEAIEKAGGTLGAEISRVKKPAVQKTVSVTKKK